MWILIFKEFTARRLYKSFGVKGLISITVAADPLSSSGKLEIAGRGSGKRNRQREAQSMRLVPVSWHYIKVKFTIEQATKAKRRSRGIALLFP
jgi:hypothetical protein